MHLEIFCVCIITCVSASAYTLTTSSVPDGLWMRKKWNHPSAFGLFVEVPPQIKPNRNTTLLSAAWCWYNLALLKVAKHLLSSPLKTTISNTCVSQTGGSSNFHYSWICGKNLDNIDEIMHKCSCFFKWPTCLRLLTSTMATLTTALSYPATLQVSDYPSTSLP